MSEPPDSLVVVLDARLSSSGHHGGVEQVVIGLAHGLSEMEGPERYVFVTREGHSEWLRPYVSGPCSIHEVAVPGAEPSVPSWRARLAAALPGGARVWRALRPAPMFHPAPLPGTDGTAELQGARVIHFPTQNGYRTALPTIYHPHDLQHRHLPEFFTPEDRAQRDEWWKTLCEQAAVVSVTSQWGKRDIATQYGIDPGKIAVVHLAPAVDAYPDVDADYVAEVRERLALPHRFALYPAQTWPHKNHLRLLKALASLRGEGLRVDLVCTGTLNEHFKEIEAEILRLDLAEQVRFLGFVSNVDLRALYATCELLVMPTLFEAAGGFGPIAEGFSLGVPVACSNVTSLPEEVGDAALVFDPLSVEAIALAMRQLWDDADLRETLRVRGRERASRYSWERTARVFRAHYRKLAGVPLAPDDIDLLAEPTDY